jgi:Flp pilus assembly protein TadG
MTATRKGPESGAAALEMALVAPLFMTMVLGTLNVGWGLYCGAEVRHAVERSTRLLIADPETPIETIEAEVLDTLSAADPDDVDVSMTTETVGTTGEIARLTWTYRYTIDVPFVEPVVLNFDSSIVAPLRPT